MTLYTWNTDYMWHLRHWLHRFFEILWHLRHWLHVTLETLITLLTIENNIIKNYFVIIDRLRQGQHSQFLRFLHSHRGWRGWQIWGMSRSSSIFSFSPHALPTARHTIFDLFVFVVIFLIVWRPQDKFYNFSISLNIVGEGWWLPHPFTKEAAIQKAKQWLLN